MFVVVVCLTLVIGRPAEYYATPCCRGRGYYRRQQVIGATSYVIRRWRHVAHRFTFHGELVVGTEAGGAHVISRGNGHCHWLR